MLPIQIAVILVTAYIYVHMHIHIWLGASNNGPSGYIKFDHVILITYV